MAGAAGDRYDLCVLGGGTAGHALAFAAAALGARCVVVDPAERLGAGGAADLAEACLVATAHRRAATLAAERGGDAPPFDVAGHRERVGRLLADTAPERAAARLISVGATVIRAQASFADARNVLADGRRIAARRFAVATGASRGLPAWAAALGPGRLLRPAAIGLDGALPAGVAVVADEPSGLLWAQVLARLGVPTTLVLSPGATAPYDPELLGPVWAALARDGVAVRRDRVVREAEAGAGVVRLRLGGGPAGAWDEGTVAAERVMVLGRPRPAVDALQLGRAGVAVRDRVPQVDGGLRTTNRRVLVLGDALGPVLASPAAVPAQVSLALRAALFRQPVRFRPAAVVHALATEPPVAQVGRVEPAAADHARRVLRHPLSATLAGRADGAAGGSLKVVTSLRGRVIGAGAVGAGAADTVNLWALALAKGLSAGEVGGLPAAPTAMAEASRRAGTNLLAGLLGGAPWLRGLLALLRRLP